MTIDIRPTGISRIHVWRIILLAIAILAWTGAAAGQEQVNKQKTPVKKTGPLTPQAAPYDTFYYQNGNLKLEAYLYRPTAPGLHPLVIYNHGSRAGSEQQEKPFTNIADILVPQGYAVLVPERRGYGKSEGKTFSDAVGNDVGETMMNRFRNEASDVLAALDYLRANQGTIENGGRIRTSQGASLVDVDQVAIMGWSHGGVVSLLAASKRHEFVALVDQAGGALTWNRSPTLQTELPAAGRQIGIPALCMDAENDATTEAVKKVGEAIKNSGQTEKTIIYPPFTPTSDPSNTPPGHLIFAQGISIWQQDLLDFLRPYLIRRVGPVRRP